MQLEEEDLSFNDPHGDEFTFAEPTAEDLEMEEAMLGGEWADNDRSEDRGLPEAEGMTGGPMRPARFAEEDWMATPPLPPIASPQLESESDPLAPVYARFAVPTGEHGLVQELRMRGPTETRRRNAPESGAILGLPFLQLVDAVDRERMAEAKLASLDAERKRPEGTASADVIGGQLWVDKYRPRSFMELLSDERINRKVLRWVKEWDPHVFKTKAPMPAAKHPGGFVSSGNNDNFRGRGSGGGKGGYAFGGGGDGGKGDATKGGGGGNKSGGKGSGKGSGKGGGNGGFDSRGGGGVGGGREGSRLGASEASRPERLLLLMSGPPGLGKTTLAHVCQLDSNWEEMCLGG
jgi:hypothetical protein